MADRYLVGNGARNWNDPNNWSKTSGGAPALDLLGAELITNSGLAGGSDWVDSNADGLADAWLSNDVNQTFRIVTGNGFTGNAQRVDITAGGSFGGIRRADQPITPSGLLSLKYRSSHQLGTNIGGVTRQIPANTGNAITYTLVLSGNTTNYFILFLTTAGGWFEIDEVSFKPLLNIPTATDNVIIDANSGTGTITVNVIANMQDFTCQNIQAITLANAAYNFNVYGSLTLHPNLTPNFSATGYLYMKATSLGKTITANGNNKGWNRIYLDGIGGEWTMQDDWNIGNTRFGLANGTFNTNNKTFTNTQGFYTESGIKTLNLGSSQLYCGWWENLASTGFTLNAGTSTIYVTLGEFSNSNGNTYYDVVLNYNGNGVIITGTNTFHNLTRIGGISAINDFIITNNQTVNGVLAISGGNSSSGRMIFATNAPGTQRTITVDPSKVIASNVDFRDIKFSNPVDLTNIIGGSGDCGGNTNITFTPSQTQYFKHTNGACNWKDSTKWFSDQAKTIAGRVPLPQDDAIFDAGSFTGASTLTVGCSRICRSLNMEAVNQAVNMDIIYPIDCYGSFILGENITLISTSIHIYPRGRGNHEFKSFNKTASFNLYFDAPGTYTFTSDAKNNVFRQYLATINLNGFTNTSTYFYCYSGTINLSNSKLVISVPLNAGNTDILYFNNTVIADNSTIQIIQTGNYIGFFSPFGKALNKVIISGANTGGVQIQQNGSFNELTIDPGKKLYINGTTTQTIKTLNSTGTDVNPISILGGSTSKYNIANSGSGIWNLDYLIISYCNATPANRLFAGLNSVDGGNNTGVVFGKAQVMNINFTESESLQAALTGKAILKASLTEGEAMAGNLIVKILMGAELTESEAMAAQLITRALMGVELQESEKINAWILNQVSIIAQLEEAEEMEGIIISRGILIAQLEEAEEMAAQIITRAMMSAQLTEDELMQASPVVIARLEAQLTESEILYIRNYEQIRGVSNFAWAIKGKSNF